MGWDNLFFAKPPLTPDVSRFTPYFLLVNVIPAFCTS